MISVTTKSPYAIKALTELARSGGDRDPGADRRPRPPPRDPGPVPRAALRGPPPRRRPALPARRQGRLRVRHASRRASRSCRSSSSSTARSAATPRASSPRPRPPPAPCSSAPRSPTSSSARRARRAWRCTTSEDRQESPVKRRFLKSEDHGSQPTTPRRPAREDRSERDAGSGPALRAVDTTGRLLTAAQVAERLGYTERYVWRLGREGVLPAGQGAGPALRALQPRWTSSGSSARRAAVSRAEDDGCRIVDTAPAAALLRGRADARLAAACVTRSAARRPPAGRCMTLGSVLAARPRCKRASPASSSVSATSSQGWRIARPRSTSSAAWPSCARRWSTARSCRRAVR